VYLLIIKLTAAANRQMPVRYTIGTAIPDRNEGIIADMAFALVICATPKNAMVNAKMMRPMVVRLFFISEVF
jgi:hypothetical protein